MALVAFPAVALSLIPVAAQQRTGAPRQAAANGAASASAAGVPAAAGDEFAQNFLAEHEIGRRFHIDPADLPAPKVGPIVTDRSLIVSRAIRTASWPSIPKPVRCS